MGLLVFGNLVDNAFDPKPILIGLEIMSGFFFIINGFSWKLSLNGTSFKYFQDSMRSFILGFVAGMSIILLL